MRGILVIPEILSIGQREELMKLCDEKKAKQSTILYLPTLVKEYGVTVLNKIPTTVEVNDGVVEVTGLSKYVTLGRQVKEIEPHTDSVVQGSDVLKLSIFLNKPSRGGALCFKNMAIDCNPGTGVLFDMRLLHWGEPFPKGEYKYLIGFRINGKLIPIHGK